MTLSHPEYRLFETSWSFRDDLGRTGEFDIMNTNGSPVGQNGDLNGSSARPVLALRETDNVGVARLPVTEGSVIEVNGRKIKALETITPGHKIALQAIPEGTPVIKYGEHIAKATADIPEGGWVHTHN